ncbi:type VII secretion protein EccB [Streptomyces sp. NPDC001941]|uniref:type VII secretion protein EccB n=1 Tax=Streptomyces sp. NPDC001941 TaxID=3154659 RepID=UPI003333E4A0
MHTRRDQVQAHLFTLSRVTAGLIRAEPDARETPMRRFTLGAVAGTALGAVALGGLVAFGFISPGVTNSFKKEGTLVIEKETGTRYVFLSGALHPVLNETSALLITGGKKTNTRTSRFSSTSGGPVTVGAKSLKDTPKGLPLGIVGAPDDLPDAKNLDRRPWNICSATRKEADGTTSKLVTAYLGGAGAGITVLDENQTMVVRGEAGGAFLAWMDRKLKVPAESTLTGLGYADVVSFDVKDAWLNSLPSGTDLTPPQAPGRGRPGPPVGGRPSVIGQVYRDPTGASYLLLQDGLTPLTQTETALVLADPGTAAAYRGTTVLPIDIGTAAVSSAPRSQRPLKATGLPVTPPQAIGTGNVGTRVPCYRVGPADSGGSKVEAAFRTNTPANMVKPAAGVPRPTGADAALIADRVVVAPGSGMLVREETTAAEAAPRIWLVTELGVKYRLASDQTAKLLGYDTTKAVPVPTSVLGLVPSGPVLDEAAAKTPLTTNP